MIPYVPGPVPADLATYLRLELEKVRTSLDSLALPSSEIIEPASTTPAAVAEAMSYAASLTNPVLVRFRPGQEYALGASVDADLPAGSVLDARGARITFTHDGGGLVLNPDFDPATNAGSDANTKRNITVLGGLWRNTNASKTASTAIVARGMRHFLLMGAKFGSETPGEGFWKAVQVGAKDSYTLFKNYFFDNAVSVHVPGDVTTLGDKTVILKILDNHFSVAGKTNAILIEDAAQNTLIEGNSTNGTTTGAQVQFNDSTLGETNDIRIISHYGEDPGTAGGIAFDATNGNGFRHVHIEGGHMASSVAGWQGIITHDIGSLFVKMRFNNSGGGATAKAITLDAASRDITIHDGARYNRTVSLFSGFTAPAVDLNGAARSDVTLTPETISVPGIGINDGTTNLNPRSLASDLAATTLDMSAVAALPGIASMALPPIAYTCGLQHNDSGSAAAPTAAYARLTDPGGSTSAVLRVDVAGVNDSEDRFAMGPVLADANGDIAVLIEATGAGTATTTAKVYAIHR